MANRLAREISPYLQQHAHNPVDWRPWGDEAFDLARRRDVPIFLSIGYSTCYWCHVMERESFDNPAIAAILNERFVPIKVDREERPDVDDIYMAATVMLSGHGGWPMSVFLEPDTLRPFFCGTYFPAEDRPGLEGRPTFPRVLQALSDAYRAKRDGVRQQAQALADAVRAQLGADDADPVELGQAHVSAAVQHLVGIFDPANGGFGKAPKFPQPVFIDFLLDARLRAGDDSTQDAIDQCVRKTLDRMACGGIRDHLGGGFHRYSVDNVWLVPHFEKMLYDNAQLAAVYARAGRFYGDRFYSEVALSTLAYVAREMTHAQGPFFSAQDAEVGGREGLNYLWLPHELRAALPDPPDHRAVFGDARDLTDADVASRVYGLDARANFQDPHHPDEPPRHVLRLPDRPDRLAPALQTGPVELSERLGRINAALRAVRDRREQPRLDDKIIVAWNGLMIHAVATCAMELEEPSLLDAARRAADFVLRRATDAEGTLRRAARITAEGVELSASLAFLEDHACLALGLCALARACEGAERASRTADAVGVMRRLHDAFGDPASGRLFDTRDGQRDLFVRTRSTHDGALPSGVSTALHAMLDLADLTSDDAWRGRALRSLVAISHAVAQSPVGTVNATRALLRLLASRAPVARAFEQAGARAAPPPPAADASGEGAAVQPVEIYASVERLTVARDHPASLTLLLKIADGYHVVAADPGDSPAARLLTPLRVGIVHGTGVAAYADYPPGHVFAVAHADPIKVYTGSVEITVALEHAGDWSGTPLVSVSYQACGATECHRPATVELDIPIDRG